MPLHIDVVVFMINPLKLLLFEFYYYHQTDYFFVGYEVLYLIEPVDEYCIQSLPEFDGKKFQNVAKEGLKLGGDDAKEKSKVDELEKEYEPLLKWLKETGLKDLIEKASVSQRLTESPCALVASSYGWSGNMERIMNAQAYAKAKDPTQKYVACLFYYFLWFES